MLKKQLLVAVTFLLVAVGAGAQRPEKGEYTRPAALGFSFNLVDFQSAERIRRGSLSSVINRDSFSSLREMEPGITVTYFKGLSNHVDFAGSLMGAFSNFTPRNGTAPNGDKFLLEADASLNLKMFPDKFIFSPYLIAGVGASRYNGEFGAFLPLGGGLKFNVLDEASISITSTYRIPVINQGNNYHFVHGIGVAGRIGAKKEVAPPAPVLPPAPADSDADGITDDVDKCPTTPGLAKYQGCPIPDTDGDGINDEEDKCPTERGIAKYAGCPIPDTDRDGVNDEEDKCPTVAGVARYAGCPIPDTDGDGINDEEDKCPALPGTRELNGCPEVKQEVVKRLNLAARNVYFATGSAKLLSKSFKGLDDVVKIMNEDQNIKLSIEGHTDNVGKDEFNQTLSENRAASVRTYLVSKGVDEGRLTSAGFGETQPVADNNTAAGKAKNRRVVISGGY